MTAETTASTAVELLDETARWSRDLERGVWLLPAVRSQPRPLCMATSKSGQPCKARAMHEDVLCVIHGRRARQGPPVRLPAAPLVTAVRARGVRVPDNAVGLAFWRAAARGSVTPYAADQMASILLAVHPASLWGDDWWTVSAP